MAGFGEGTADDDSAAVVAFVRRLPRDRPVFAVAPVVFAAEAVVFAVEAVAELVAEPVEEFFREFFRRVVGLGANRAVEDGSGVGSSIRRRARLRPPVRRACSM